jgi:hypothetical protein
MIGHFYHGVHFEMWQFKMSKHVLTLKLWYAFMIIAHQPRCDHNIAILEPIVYNLYVGYVSGPFG